ncbi:MAG: hypothetical protein HOC91_07700 [Nitrospinaceae bacterium]|nr:hypothetical protein [Nitrospinaceae bacterium]MBT3433522.1 hypothetical protein [Nitrospinaceae bacterium]MBT3822317.1 hypothetical protein [Nitrospinaceae bacterium]MBT4430382.1 hypothetical protein [Nitrospinaceae bacterium]MBT5367175.1 hypothetical protein [Nitrospinaceae bacterium]
MTYDMNFLLFFLIFLVIFVTAIIIIFKQLRQKRQAQGVFKGIVEAFNPGGAENITKEKWTQKMSAAIAIGGTPYTIAYTPRAKRNNQIIPAHFDLSLKCAINVEFTIREEGALDRLGKNIGIAVEIQTGDTSFDNAFYIESEDRIFMSTFLGEPARREAIRALMRIGFAEINLDGEEMTASWDDFQPGDNFNTGPIEEAAGQLTTLCEDIPEISIDTLRSSVSASSRNAPPSKIRYGILYGLPIIFTVFLTIWNMKAGTGETPIDFFPFILYTLRYSLPAIIVYFFIALRVLRAGSTAHLSMVKILFVSIIMFGVSGYQLGMYLNSHQDTGEPKIHTLQIVSRTASSSSSKNSHAPYIQLKPWPPRTETIKIDISQKEYASIIVGRTLAIVTTRPGALGFEWIASYKFDGPFRTASASGLSPTRRLRDGAKNGKLEEVKRLLLEGTKVDAKSRAGFTALHLAAQFGHADVVRLLLSKGANINVQTRKGWSPLLHAVNKQHREAYEALLEAGADTMLKNRNDWTPLQKAARAGDVFAINGLLGKGADINAHTEKRPTAIYYAALKGHTEAVEILLKKGADANLTFSKWTPLGIAVKQGHTEAAALLRKSGAR